MMMMWMMMMKCQFHWWRKPEHRERIIEKTRKFQIVYAGQPRGIELMMNERKQSAMAKARYFKHSKTTGSFLKFNLSPTSRYSISLFHMRGGGFEHFNTSCTFIYSNKNIIINVYIIGQSLV